MTPTAGPSPDPSCGPGLLPIDPPWRCCEVGVALKPILQIMKQTQRAEVN